LTSSPLGHHGTIAEHGGRRTPAGRTGTPPGPREAACRNAPARGPNTAMRVRRQGEGSPMADWVSKDGPRLVPIQPRPGTDRPALAAPEPSGRCPGRDLSS
jgi:hypothetical protein